MCARQPGDRLKRCIWIAGDRIVMSNQKFGGGKTARPAGLHALLTASARPTDQSQARLGSPIPARDDPFEICRHRIEIFHRSAKPFRLRRQNPAGFLYAIHVGSWCGRHAARHPFQAIAGGRIMRCRDNEHGGRAYATSFEVSDGRHAHRTGIDYHTVPRGHKSIDQ